MLRIISSPNTRTNMRNIDREKPILVTDGAGYLASWVVKQLLEQGLEVRTTVSNLGQKEKYAQLTKMSLWHSGRLTFFESDLLRKGSFSEAMDGCELVIHTAVPYRISGLENSHEELIKLAMEGMCNVLDSVNATESVKRLVFTSGIEAIFGDAIDINKTKTGLFTEADWNFSSSLDHQSFSYVKTLAEKLAWEMVEKQSRWDLLVINPGITLGPSLSKRTDSKSIDMLIQFLNGKFEAGAPSGDMSFVDVRDVAKAHVLAGFAPNASGRHICSANERGFLDVADVVRAGYPQLPLPKRYFPKWLFWLMAPKAGFTRKYVKMNVGINVRMDNSYIKKDLDMKFLPFEHTIADHVEQLIRDGIIKEP